MQQNRENRILSPHRIVVKLALYRMRSWLKHRLIARHTGGHGVHSPYLFEWVRMILHDRNAYYAWGEIEALREGLLHDEREVMFVDYGSAARCQKKNEGSDTRRICDIARKSLARKKYAQMLARLVGWLGASRWSGGQEQAPTGEGLVILELGTSLGITTAYLAAMDSRNRVVTCEGCEAVAKIAKTNWRALGLDNVDCLVGELTPERLQQMVERIDGRLDVAFVDANHTYASTCAYFNILAQRVHDKSVIVVDDIHHSPEMERAWKEICADERVTSTMDFYQMGMVFFDKHYWRRDYRIRL